MLPRTRFKQITAEPVKENPPRRAGRAERNIGCSDLPYVVLSSVATRTEVHAMRTFLVTFHKIIPDGRGHDHRALQRQAVVSASSGEAAADAAKALFCQTVGIVDWRLRADTCEVVGLADLSA